MRRSIALLALCSVLACGGAGPLPPERADYAGQWQGDGVMLTITAAGEVRYDRAEGKGRVQVEGPIAGWKDQSFVVGVMTVKTAFEVNEVPHEEGGVWKMTVNGDELIRLP